MDKVFPGLRLLAPGLGAGWRMHARRTRLRDQTGRRAGDLHEASTNRLGAIGGTWQPARRAKQHRSSRGQIPRVRHRFGLPIRASHLQELSAEAFELRSQAMWIHKPRRCIGCDQTRFGQNMAGLQEKRQPGDPMHEKVTSRKPERFSSKPRDPATVSSLSSSLR